MMTTKMIDRLYSDVSLTSNLHPEQTEQLLSWAEGYVQEYASTLVFDRFCDELRLLNRYVGQGGRFDHLFAQLRNERLQQTSTFVALSGDQSTYRYPFALLF